MAGSDVVPFGEWPRDLEITYKQGLPHFTYKGEPIDKTMALAMVYDAQGNAGRDRWKERHRAVAEPGQLVQPTGIMVIAEVDGGVRLYASREIPRAHFGMELVDFRTEWKIGSVMKQMLIITRPTLGECLAELGRIWGNHDRDAAQRELAERGEVDDIPGIERGPATTASPRS